MPDLKKIIDISLPLNERTIVYPGNPPFGMEKIKSPGGSQLAKISFGTHFGTHADAPSHVFADGKNTNELPLDNFIGHCRVLDASKCAEAVNKKFLEKFNIRGGERILLKTKNSRRGYQEFYKDYIYLAGDAAKYLADKNVKLIGIDYLSVKQKGSSDNTPHTALLEKNIAILEGINLNNVEPGKYFLLAAPLALDGADGSPARALLLKITGKRI
jgi:arylformamidase